MAPTPLLTLRAATAGHDRPLFGPVDLALAPGDRMVLVGRNGAGKSTFLRLLAGGIAPDRGERWVQPGMRIGHLVQDPPRGAAGSAADLAAGAGGPAHRVDQLLHALGVDGGAEAATLSDGQARRAALAGVLATDPDILLLDEPTNHLDLASIAWLEAELARFKGALVVISHDRAFLRAVGNGMLWLDAGRLRRRDQGFALFERWAEEVAEVEAGEAARLAQRLKEEERYRERGVTARRRRNQRRVEKLAALRAERKQRQAARVGTVSLDVEAAAPGGRLVVEAQRIAKAYDGRVLFQDFSTRILRGDRIGIVGPNGAGKTTLLKSLIGEIAPDAGSVRLGEGVEIAHVDQTRAALDPDLSVLRSIGEGSDYVEIGGKRRHVAGYLGDFLFDGARLTAKVSTLSGGERNRLLLAKTLARSANLLILDEPTNDLDMDTLDVLEAFLADWPGTLILVSHDRDFLDRTVGSVIGLDGRGGIREVVGGYADWVGEVAADAVEVPAAKPAKPAGKPAAKSGAGPNKLGYKDARELAGLPERMAGIEAEIAALEAELADPTLYARDAARVAAAGEALRERQAALEKAETRWLELEEKREALEAARAP